MRYYEKGHIDGLVVCIYNTQVIRGAVFLKEKKRAQPTASVSGANIYYNNGTLSGTVSVTLPTQDSIRIQVDGSGYSNGNCAYINDVDYVAEAEL